ncbi:MAG: hypothetical protein EPO24_10550 [Bacteroidetes bacterium]|nr:MAG: hypothetical protein EPO24_10550 [Bacteroidota bacterium]
MVRLYLDEDVNVLLALLLQARSINITTAHGQKMLGRSDVEQLDFASTLNAALVTHNRVDFEKLFQEYIENERRYDGIIVLIRRDVYTMAQ